jgi:hypothetical protein
MFFNLPKTALTLNAVKLVLSEMAAFHASGYQYIQSYPGNLEALAKDCPRVNSIGFLEDIDISKM